MKLSFFEEPDLEFGGGGTHVDVRYGITQYGPLDVGDTKAPTQLKLGLIGTDETIAAIREWFARCKGGVARKESKLANLFPAFPGFTDNVSFRSSLAFHDRWCSPIRQREIDAVLAHSDGDDTVRQSVAMFVDRAAELVQQGGPMVLVCVPPHDLLAAVDERRGGPPDIDVQEIDEGSEPADAHLPPTISFHDLLKAEGMRLTVPFQMVRPKTYGGGQLKKKRRGKRTSSTPLQDEATRAWNIHTALYYKAGGIPWRLVRDAAALTTCFVGISFYRTLDKARLLTSVAQVFNERGEGVIVKGAQAQLDKNDKTPHLSSSDAHALLKRAIEVYRREHRTSPARIVVHKTSRVLPEEAEGFDAAAQGHAIDTVELLTVRRSLSRLLREGMLSYMAERELLWNDHGILSVGREGEQTFGRRHFLDLLSSFTTEPLFSIKHGKLDIGRVHQSSFAVKEDHPPVLLLAGLSWVVTHIDWDARVAFVEPTKLEGKSRWLGSGQALRYSLCQAIQRVLAGEEPGATLSKRGEEQLAQTRSEFPWLTGESTHVVRSSNDRLLWWTFAGLFANSAIAEAIRGQSIQVGKVDNFVIALDASAPRELLDIALKEVRALEAETLRTPVSDRAVSELKFSECLPDALAKKVLSERMTDVPAAATTLSRPMRIVAVETS